MNYGNQHHDNTFMLPKGYHGQDSSSFLQNDLRSSPSYHNGSTDVRVPVRVTNYIAAPQKSYILPPAPPAKYPHRGYHPGMPFHMRDEHYADPYLVWGVPGGNPIDHPHTPEYPLQDAWYMYPTGPWRTWWSGRVPNNSDTMLLCEAKPKPHDHRTLESTRPNNGVAVNEQAFIHPEAFGREYVSHDLAIRNVRWKHIGSMMPDEEAPTVEGKKRHLAMLIQEPRGMAPAVDIKGIEGRKFDYARIHKFRREESLFPGRRAQEKEYEVFDDEALAEFFADPEAMLEREFKVM